MKLFEIRDISDYQRGDELDPRSPYYEDPLEDDDDIPEYFRPNYPSYYVDTTGGTAPNGEQYNLKITSKFISTDRDEAIIDEYVWDSLAGDKRFQMFDLVDEELDTKGYNKIYTQYAQVGRGFPVDQLEAAMDAYAKEQALIIAKENFLKTYRQYGRNWQKHVDY